MDIKIIDEDGDSWVTNTGEYRMVHTSRESMPTFEPGQPTKVNMDPWIKGQPTLAVTDDPLSKSKKPATK